MKNKANMFDGTDEREAWDRYAAAALATFISWRPDNEESKLANWAALAADALLEERRKRDAS